MVFVLMFCVHMSSSGTTCDDVAQFSTIDACVAEADKRKPKERHNEQYICEGRIR